jgi:hypothetical protein
MQYTLDSFGRIGFGIEINAMCKYNEMDEKERRREEN